MFIDINKCPDLRDAVSKAAANGVVTVDLGCGKKKVPGSIGIDHIPFDETDFVVNLGCDRLPLENDSVDLVWADQLIEHIDNLVPLMIEIRRILRPGGQFIAKTPYFRSAYAVVDPTHVRFFSIMSMDYYVEAKYLFRQYGFFAPGFSSVIVRLDYETSFIPGFFYNLVARRALANPRQFENSTLSFLFPFSSISYSLLK